MGDREAEAVMWAVLLERACKAQLLAESAGQLRNWIDGELPEFDWPARQLRAGYGYLVRRGRLAYRDET